VFPAPRAISGWRAEGAAGMADRSSRAHGRTQQREVSAVWCRGRVAEGLCATAAGCSGVGGGLGSPVWGADHTGGEQIGPAQQAGDPVPTAGVKRWASVWAANWAAAAIWSGPH
jgi:hypothetical protein